MLAALKNAVRLFWLDFAPIVLMGLGLLTAPSLLLHLLIGPVPEAGRADGDSFGTLAQTAVAVLAMLFFAAVTHGGLLRLGGRILAPGRYIRESLAAARPGVLVTLIVGAAALMGAVVLLLGRGHAMGPLSGGVALAFIVWLAILWLAALPVAVAERLSPIAALRRAHRLTRGHKARIAGIVGIATLALLPPAMLVNSVVFGPTPTPEVAARILSQMSLLHPGLWVAELFWMLVYGLLACLPPAVYAALRGIEATG
jgi:hypothetical protein